MVDHQIEDRGITNPKVLSAMLKVKRHLFVEPDWVHAAYEDRPLPIGHDQTISQPYIVAVMTDLLNLTLQSTVLEVGTGSVYQAAILAEIAAYVYTVEIIKELADLAEKRLTDQGYKNISYKVGDGYHGWPEHPPFDGIVVTAAAPLVPPKLVEQLKPGGRLVIPVGPTDKLQELIVVDKQTNGTVIKKSVMPVRFVPFTGDH